MSRSAGISWRARAGAIAVILPLVALSACSSQNDQMAEKVAAAEAAAEKAIAAQHAAEKAAAAAVAVRPAPTPATEPTVVSDTDDGDDADDDGDSGAPDDQGGAFSMGGEGQTVTPDGVVVPGQGV